MRLAAFTGMLMRQFPPTLALVFAVGQPVVAQAGGPAQPDVRYMAQIEAVLDAALSEAIQREPSANTGQVAIVFRIDSTGGIATQDLAIRSGHSDLDGLAIRALIASIPLAPPPPGSRPFVWTVTFKGTTPFLTTLHEQ